MSRKNFTLVSLLVVLGIVLSGTVFLLDYIYALVDPRVKIGQGDSNL